MPGILAHRPLYSQAALVKGTDGFALLGRREAGYLEVLAFDAEDGKVLCLFDTQELAKAFATVSPDIRGQGWSVHVMTFDALSQFVKQFDYVTVNPSPQVNSRKDAVCWDSDQLRLAGQLAGDVVALY
jgi:hypothetical protein